MGRYDVDLSRAPIAQVTLEGTFTEPQHIALMGELDRMLQSGTHVCLFDTSAAAFPPATQRQRQGEWMKRNDALIRRTSLGLALVVPSRVMRSAITAMLWFHTPAIPLSVHETRAQAWAWCCDRLRAAGQPVPAAVDRRAG